MGKFEDVQDAIKIDIESPHKQRDEAYIDEPGWKDAERDAYIIRNQLYCDILNNYLEINKAKADANKNYKFWFFLVSMLIFSVLTIGPIIVFVIMACKENATITDLATVLGCITGIITSIIVIPKIIAKHLFPTDEDTHMIEMVKNMQINDSKIRDAYKGTQQKHQ